jgi:LacI family transcriptional regulator
VQELARELGYRPNGMARRVQEGRYRGMALLGSAERPGYNVWDQDFHIAVGTTLGERSWHLTEGWLPGAGLADPAVVAGLLDRMLADVVLVHDVGDQPPMVEAVLAQHRVLTVWVNAGRKHDSVDFADAPGVRTAVDHLLAQGYRRPALLLSSPPGGPSEHISVSERVRGFREACRHHGLPARLVHPPVVGDRIVQATYLASLMASADRPDALVCYSSKMLPAVRISLADRGLRVGRDLGLVSFGRADEGVIDQAYTQIGQDYTALGQQAVHLAWRLLETSQRQPQVLIPEPLLRPGASTTR